MSLIRVESLTKRFGEQTVLSGVDLTVSEGQVHFILGRSGVGKSVLLRHLVGLLEPTSGGLWYRNQSLIALDAASWRRVRERCQLIFQHPTLFEQFTVLENVAMPLRKRFGLRDAQARERALGALAIVEADSYADQRPAELGRGVQKRVSVARALALAPETLLYDEPTTALDPVSARRLDHMIRRMADERGVTSLIVSHDLQSVNAIADRVSFLDRGRIAFDGSLADWRRCTDPAVVRFCRRGRPP